MTDLSKFQFYLYDSIVDQGLVRTLILAVDGDTGITKITSRSGDGSNDYINTNLRENGNNIENPTIDDLLLSNTKSYIRAHKLFSTYQADYNEIIHANGKPKLRINHLSTVMGYYYDWFKLNNHSLPKVDEGQILNIENLTVKICGEVVRVNERQAYLLLVLQNSDVPLTTSFLLSRLDAMLNTITSYTKVSEIFKKNKLVYNSCILVENRLYSLKDNF
jgi:hypothetical protein